MDEVTLNAYVIYAFLGAVVLLLITLIGAVLRFTYVVGKIQGQITGLEGQITGLQGQISFGLQGQIVTLVDCKLTSSAATRGNEPPLGRHFRAEAGADRPV